VFSFPYQKENTFLWLKLLFFLPELTFLWLDFRIITKHGKMRKMNSRNLFSWKQTRHISLVQLYLSFSFLWLIHMLHYSILNPFDYLISNQWSVGLPVKIMLYLCKGENTSSISRKRTYWEEQPRTPNGISLTL
jgi:hypothetical protein